MFVLLSSVRRLVFYDALVVVVIVLISLGGKWQDAKHVRSRQFHSLDNFNGPATI